MGWKEIVSGYFHFSKKDRTGVLVLLALIGVAILLPYLASEKVAPPIPLDAGTTAAMDSLQKNTPRQGRYSEDYRSYAFEPSEREYNPAKGELFLFDPNTLDSAGWLRLGLPPRAIRTLNKYRSKGGRFHRPEDLAKIYSLPTGFYERVKGHIRIAPTEYKTRFNSAPPEENFTNRPYAVIDINTADTTAFVALPGIGSRLAARIVNFRNKLGGFTSVEQVGETYGVPDSTFQKIKHRLRLENPAVQQININTATKEQLSAHPYISWKLANAIVAYREQHGPYTTMGDLQKIMITDDATFEKLKPYLAL